MPLGNSIKSLVFSGYVPTLKGLTHSPRYFSIDPMRLVHPTIDLDSSILEPDVKQKYNIAEFYSSSAWTFSPALVYLHADYVSVQYNGGLVLDIIVFTLSYYYWGTQLDAMKSFCLYSLCFHLNILTTSPPLIGWMLILFRCVHIFFKLCTRSLARLYIFNATIGVHTATALCTHLHKMTIVQYSLPYPMRLDCPCEAEHQSLGVAFVNVITQEI